MSAAPPDGPPAPAAAEGPATVSIPVLEEHLEVAHRVVERGGLRIDKTVETRQETVDEPLRRESLRVERRPVGRLLAPGETVEPRQDGETLVIPVLEEVLVVERRTRLAEELLVHRTRETFRAPQRVALRSERVRVERIDRDGHAVSPSSPSPASPASLPPPDPSEDER